MGPFAVGILVPLAFFAMLFGIVYMTITARNRERMAMIEKGADASLFEAKKKPNNGGYLKLGMFLFGIGLGILMGYFLTTSGMDEDAAYPAMIFVFGGLGLIVSHLYQQKIDKAEQQDK
jgi:hypothetical protein